MLAKKLISGPFPVALQGYAVVAPDYSGLGVQYDTNGSFIPHHWSANPEGGNNLLDSVSAAQKAFPKLSRQFVALGYSEGGGFAWGAAQQQLKRKLQGYLGGVAASPLSTVFLRQAIHCDCQPTKCRLPGDGRREHAFHHLPRRLFPLRLVDR